MLLVAGAFAVRTLRKYRAHPAADPSAEAPLTMAPPPAAPEATPAGAIAWEADTLAPILVSVDPDEVEDIFGFFREWDGRSAWTAYGGVFDGATLAPVWRTEPIDPHLSKRDGVLPSALAVGSRLVVSDTSPILRVFDLARGTKLLSLRMADGVVDMCKGPDAARVWVRVLGDQNALVDLDAGKATFAPRPAWCTTLDDRSVGPATHAPPKEVTLTALPAGAWAIERPLPRPGRPAGKGSAEQKPDPACTHDFLNRLARATCLPADQGLKLEDGAVGRYVLKSGTAEVLLGLSEDRPIAVGFGPGSKQTWSTPLVPDETKPVPEAPRVAELVDGTLYAVYGKVYFDARVAAFDAGSGERRWDVPLVGSVASGSIGGSERGEARGLVASKTRVYVPRAGGGLDVFNAKDGSTVGTIGKK